MTDIDALRELLRAAHEAEDANRTRPGYLAYCDFTDQIQHRLNLARKAATA